MKRQNPNKPLPESQSRKAIRPAPSMSSDSESNEDHGAGAIPGSRKHKASTSSPANSPAQLIILDKMGSHSLEPATVVQAIGRTMRPQAPARPRSAHASLFLCGRTPSGTTRAPVTLGKTANSETARYLRAEMDKMRPSLEFTAKQDADAFLGKIDLPQWRDADGTRTATSHKSIEDLLNTDARFIPYPLFAEMQHHDSQLATLGGVPTDGRVTNPFLRSSNKEVDTFNHIYDNMEEVLRPVIRETDDFALRPQQRLAIGAYLQRYPMELHARVRRLGDACSLASQVGMAPLTRPNISLVNFATGNGKTVMGITMAMTEICDPELWKGLQERWRPSLWSNSSVEGLGLTRCNCLSTQELARVVIAFVPTPLIGQWRHTAGLVNDAMRIENQYGFEIWEGLGVLQRSGGAGGQETVRRTLREAHRRSRETGEAILWIVPAKTESAHQTVRDDPRLAFASKLVDEGTSTTDPRQYAPESPPITNIFLQATVDRLAKATQNQPRHPIRVALSNQTYDPHNTEHACIFHMLSLPDWLRFMVGSGMADVMPCGLKRIGLKIRVQSLSGRLLKSDLTITGIDALLKTVLTNVGGDAVLEAQERDDLREKCQRILGTSVSPSAGAPEALAEMGGTIYERLRVAESSVNKQMTDLPQKPAPQNPPIRPTREEEEYWYGIEEKRRAYNATMRMFGALADSMSPDQPAECPITLDDIPPEHAAIFPCCTNLFDGRHRHRLGKNCPMCNQPLLDGILNAQQAVTAIGGEAPPAPKEPAKDPSQEECIVDDEPKLIEALESLSSEDKAFSGSIKAVVETVRTFLRYKPRGARILLAFACEGNENQATRQTRTTLNAALPGLLDSIEAITAKAVVTIKAFVTEDDSNRVLLINTNDRSLSLEGLDLWTAQLIILDKMGSHSLKPATVVQAIGRIMRPQFSPYIPTGTGVTGASSSSTDALRPRNVNAPKRASAVGHPAKWLVLLERSEAAGAGEGQNQQDDQMSESDEEEEDHHDGPGIDVDDDGWQQMPDNEDNANVAVGEEEWQDVDFAALQDVDPEEARALLDAGN